jgi:phenylpropionate dioxygenase-like ring-hydroxylating dioxygenase large terminal subunit
MEYGPDTYRLDHGVWTSRSVSAIRTFPNQPDYEYPYDIRGELQSGQFALVWPNFTIGQSPGARNIAVSRIVPLGPNQTIRIFDYFYDPSTPVETQDIKNAFLAKVFAEDTELVEMTQRGLRSGVVPYTTLLPESEALIVHFQALVRKHLVEQDESKA